MSELESVAGRALLPMAKQKLARTRNGSASSTLPPAKRVKEATVVANQSSQGQHAAQKTNVRTEDEERAELDAHGVVVVETDAGGRGIQPGAEEEPEVPVPKKKEVDVKEQLS